jgi:2-iminobutanoate/2-iminopropanoate deaminase
MSRPASLAVVALCAVPLLACDVKGPGPTAPTRQVIGEVTSPNYSPAVRVGDLVFLSGSVGLDPSTKALVPGGIQAETRQTLANIEQTLATTDLDLGDVAKCTVFLADMADYGAMNQVYSKVWPAEPPARTTVQALPPMDARVEIECVAAARR